MFDTKLFGPKKGLYRFIFQPKNILDQNFLNENSFRPNFSSNSKSKPRKGDWLIKWVKFFLKNAKYWMNVLYGHKYLDNNLGWIRLD